MQHLANEELHVDVPIKLCSKERIWAKDEINGRFKYVFDKLFDYAATLRQVDPICNVVLMVVSPTPNLLKIFRRIYICFGVTKDGCFLKGTFNGGLFSVVGKDVDDQIYPIVWVFIE
ncbi:hypothetical protein V6N13_098768 [Hibiscus sabdariffa]|uniref:Uncharacterized protein n=1 Tax=Hibiscus sabdariffa TaxID=183260 RepID=A0ABR2EEW1_9ROSI